MTGEGIAAILTAAGGFVTSIGTIILQLRQAKISRSNSDKLDDVHSATVSIAENTGTHQVLPPP